MLDVCGRLELEGRPYVERGLHRVGECAEETSVLVPLVGE